MKKLTFKRLQNIALYYLERYDTSSAHLKSVLKRRILKARTMGADIDENADNWIDEIVQSCIDNGYVKDKDFAQRVVERLTLAGHSRKYIYQSLYQKGISENLISEVCQISDEDEYENALKFAKKKKVYQDYQKGLAQMARAGYSYEIARKVLAFFQEDQRSGSED